MARNSPIAFADGTPLSSSFKALFLIVAGLTLVTGAVMFLFPVQAGGMPPGVAPAEARPLWPWPLTPLVSRYLGSLFLGVGIGSAFASRQQWWREVRAMVIPGVVFTGLALLASAMHLASFNPQRITTWLYFVLYALVFLAALLLGIRHEQSYRAGR